jgi:tryptophan synthase alpha chain
MTRIGRLFERLREERRPGLIAYVTAGDPCPNRTSAIVEALQRGGADLIELGVPFSDPVADGPVIQRASDRALRHGTSLPRVLDIAREIRSSAEVPLLLFSYLNPVMRYGVEALAREAAGAGIDGCLLIDLSVEEANSITPALRAAGLDTVFLAAPTSTERRRRLVAEHSSGFVYLVSRTGVTGEKDTLSDALTPLVSGMRSITSLPLAVGFGISTPEQAAAVGTISDAVVVGSAFVRTVEQYADSRELEPRLTALARDLRKALE